MLNKKLAILAIAVMIVPMILTACGPTPAPVVVKETSVVVQTVVVEQTPVEVTSIVEKEVVVTATPEPTAGAAEVPVVSPEFKNPDTYVVITGAGEPETLDPAWTYETAGSAAEGNIYEGLVWFNKTSYDKFIPALATDWTTSEDGLTWNFTIRKASPSTRAARWSRTTSPTRSSAGCYRAAPTARSGCSGRAFSGLTWPWPRARTLPSPTWPRRGL